MPPTAPHYATPTELRTELDVSAGTLPDLDANLLLSDAEDRIDELLGARTILVSGDYTGRKVDVPVLTTFEAERLARATVLMAAAEYRTPGVFADPQYESVSGPDFSHSRGESGLTLAQAAARPAIYALNASGLRRLGARISG